MPQMEKKKGSRGRFPK